MGDTSNKGMASADEQTRKDVGHQGGQATAATHGSDFYSEIGKKGGKAAQESPNRHDLTDEERSKGGQKGGSQ